MNVKAAEDQREALQALWPRLQSLAVEPVRDEADFVERSAFQATAFYARYAVRLLHLKPNEVVPGWDEHFVALVRENRRASNALEKTKTVAGQLERKRLDYAVANQPLMVPPPDQAMRNFGVEVPLAPARPAAAESRKYERRNWCRRWIVQMYWGTGKSETSERVLSLTNGDVEGAR